MGRSADPFYNRKAVPDELIKDVGLTGLTPEEEYWNRERKYSAVDGVDVRRFSNSKRGGIEPQDDPYYGRRRVSDAEITNVGHTGLAPEQEYWNRERKYSVTGVDVRKFSGKMEPAKDPYYSRKRVSGAETANVGPLNTTPAEQYSARERKQSLFQLSSDPFDQLAGRHRQPSVSDYAAGAATAATRRRSSAVAPDAVASHSGHNHPHITGERLAPIESRPEVPTDSNDEASRATEASFNRDTAAGSSGVGSKSSPTATGVDDVNTATAANTTPGTSSGTEHTRFHDAVTVGHDHGHRPFLPDDDDGPDSVAPHEVR